jgi:hypothetical protein
MIEHAEHLEPAAGRTPGSNRITATFARLQQLCGVSHRSKSSLKRGIKPRRTGQTMFSNVRMISTTFRPI